MINVVDVKAVSEFKLGENIGPERADLCCNIHPQSLDSNVVNTPSLQLDS